jgi:hypothetical protein
MGDYSELSHLLGDNETWDDFFQAGAYVSHGDKEPITEFYARYGPTDSTGTPVVVGGWYSTFSTTPRKSNPKYDTGCICLLFVKELKDTGVVADRYSLTDAIKRGEREWEYTATGTNKRVDLWVRVGPEFLPEPVRKHHESSMRH